MPQTTKSRKSLLYTFIIVQVLLNVTFTSAAVIRREKREIAANVTGIAASNNELDLTAATNDEDEESSIFETGPSGIGTTTAKSLSDTTTIEGSEGKKEVTTLKGSTIDENTVSFDLDDEESNLDSRNEENIVESNIDENTTIESQSEGSKTVLKDETSTVDVATTTLTTDRGTVAKEETSVTDEGKAHSTTDIGSVAKEETSVTDESAHDDTRNTVESETVSREEPSTTTISQLAVKADETTSQTTVDSATLSAVDSHATSTEIVQNEASSLKSTDEGTTLSTIKPDETTNVSTKRAQTEPTEMSSDDISTTFATGEYHEIFTNGVSPIPSTPLSEVLTDDTNSWTSTIKSDDSTAILTSTETSDDSPVQTTFYTSPLSQDPVNVEMKNSTTSSAEKRGKFIDDNYSSPNELHLPNNSDVWALAGMKSAGKPKSSELQNSVETSDEKAINNSMATKSLLDWTRVMMSTHAMDTETTAKIIESTTTEALADKTTTELRTFQENEVETLTTKSPADATTEVVKTVIPESTPQRENEVDTKTPPRLETTTNLSDAEGETIPERFTMEDTSLPQVDDIVSTTKSSLNLLKGQDDTFIEDNKVDGNSVEEEQPSPTTTTTTTTSLPNLLTMKSETTHPLVNGGPAEEVNTDTISTSTSSFDFTTSMPFLTSTSTTTTTTTTTTTPPPIVFNMDDRTNEPPNMESTLTPSQSSPAAVAIVEQPLTTTTTTTTMTTTTTSPAVTVMAATTETQTTEAHTPAIISSDDTMTQKSNNYNNYEVVNKTSTKFADNSSIGVSEVSTRVSPYWVASTADTSATEVDKLDKFDVTTASNFDNYNNAYEIATPEPSTTVGITLTVAPTTIPTTTAASSSSTSTEDLDHIESIHRISDTGETAIESNVIDPLQAGEASTTTTTKTTTTTATTRTTESSQENMRMQSTGRGEVDFSSTTTTTPRYDDDSTTTLQSISTKKEDVYSIVPTIDSGFHVPKLVVDDPTTTSVAGVLAAGVGVGPGGGGAGGQSMDSPDAQETDVNVIIAISVSVVGIVALILLVAFLYVMRKRQKQMSYGQRCRPVSLDAYSLDNVSVYNSVRRKGAALRASKRSYGNVAFDDPSLRHNVLGTHELAKYVEKKSSIWEEFKDVPQIIARADEVPAGCEDRNRYANVIPLPETRVILQQQNGDEKSEYINANYVRGPKDTTNYYIACQAPLDTTVTDFWRMIWEQNSRVIIMATDLIENGIDKCAEYLPPSVTLDNHTVFGDYQVTLKNREVKEKYAISTLMLKNTATEETREITHYWYQWPEAGVPTDEAAIIAMLLEARSSLKLYTIEQSDTKIDTIITDEKPTAKSEINGNVASEKPKQPPKDQGPLTIHCSPGTGRTGTILACDIAMRCLEEPKRSVDIPQIVYSVRRGRASAVQTKEQYEFIYKVTHMYATKISNLNNDN